MMDFQHSYPTQIPFVKSQWIKTIEETINKDTQMVGGTKGFSLKARAVAKYYIDLNTRHLVLKMRQIAEMQHEGLNHSDLRP